LTPWTCRGVDIEELDQSIDPLSLASSSLAARERAELAALPEPDRLAAFFRYWTRKEAALKTTGDGLRCPPSEIVVSAPDQPAAVVSWSGRDVSGPRLADLEIAAGYAACVGYASPTRLSVRVVPAATVLGGLD
jgi:4'-phosphopantetheinyl transferase